MYAQETKGVVVRVEPHFLDEESEPEDNRFFWTYSVAIENTGAEPIQLVGREWRITDAKNRTEIVRGRGVVGEEPVIEPGQSFRYTSAAPLATASGFMAGAYTMVSQGGDHFEALIPSFALDSPYGAATRH